MYDKYYPSWVNEVEETYRYPKSNLTKFTILSLVFVIVSAFILGRKSKK